jgi:hypothetical protein
MNEPDDDIQRMLLRYRPAGPTPDLRRRILARPAAPERPLRIWPQWLYRGAVAAMLMLAIYLNTAANDIAASTAARVGVGPAQWTPEAEQLAGLIGGEGGRQYIALCLMGSTARTAQ